MIKKILFFSFLLFILVSCSADKKNEIKSVICFGDSLTEGLGSSDGKTYPYFLQRLLPDIKIVNKGISGNTSSDGLNRIDDIIKSNPSVVIVEFGANDFFRQIPLSKTKENTERIIDKLQNAGIKVVLVSTQDGHLNALYKMLKEMSKKKKVLFIDGILNEIWNERQLFYDEIHPNSKGYELIAEKIYNNIKPLIDN